MLNLANLLTYLRIILIPFILSSYFFVSHPLGSWVAFGLYVCAGISDYVDGFLARKFNMGSVAGKVLDPIADKLLITSILLMLLSVRVIDNWYCLAAAIIIMRELLVSGLREFLVQIGGKGIAVSRLAKWKTAAQIGSLGFLIVGDNLQYAVSKEITFSCIHLGIFFLVLASILTIITGWGYIILGYKEIKGRTFHI